MTTGARLLVMAMQIADTAAHVGQPDIVVTGRTDPGQPDGVSVDGDQLRQTGSPTILDALNKLPGVYAVQTGGVGGDSFLSVRGGEPNFTLVMLDGIRLNDPLNTLGGGFDFAELPPSAISRIRVAGEPLSAVHGSDALAGVVEIDTVGADVSKSTLVANATTDTAENRQLDGGGSVAWRAGGQATIAANLSDSGELTKGSHLARLAGLATIREGFGTYSLELVGLDTRTQRSAFPQDSGGPRLAVVRAEEARRTELGLIGLRLAADPTAKAGVNASASWTSQQDDRDTPRIAAGALSGVPGIVADTLFRRGEATIDAFANLGWTALAAGLDYTREDARSVGTLDFGRRIPADYSIVRQDLGGFVETTIRPIAGLSTTVAVRADSPSGRPAVVTGRLSARLSLTGSVTTFASAGSAYKLPSLFALAYPLIANPNLRPERSRGVEGGVATDLTATSKLTMTVFRTFYRDLIDFDPAAFTDVNRDSVTVTGFEATAEWRLSPRFTAAGSLTHVAVASESPLRSRPRWRGAWNLEARLDDATKGFVAASFNTGFYDSSVPTGLIRQPGHITVDVGLRHRLGATLAFGAAILNVGNARWEDAVGFPAPGRTLRINVTVSP